MPPSSILVAMPVSRNKSHAAAAPSRGIVKSVRQGGGIVLYPHAAGMSHSQMDANILASTANGLSLLSSAAHDSCSRMPSAAASSVLAPLPEGATRQSALPHPAAALSKSDAQSIPQPQQIIPALTSLLKVLSTSAHERTVQQLIDVVAAQSVVIKVITASKPARERVVQELVQIEQLETQGLLQ